jgi:hypothetical protein
MKGGEVNKTMSEFNYVPIEEQQKAAAQMVAQGIESQKKNGSDMSDAVARGVIQAVVKEVAGKLIKDNLGHGIGNAGSPLVPGSEVAGHSAVGVVPGGEIFNTATHVGSIAGVGAEVAGIGAPMTGIGAIGIEAAVGPAVAGVGIEAAIGSVATAATGMPV